MKSKKFKINFFLVILIFCLLTVNSSWGKNSETQVDLFWSTDTYIPFNYLGRPLPVPGSAIEVFAVVDGKSSRQRDLDFYWSIDNQPQNYASGKGENVFKFTVPWASAKNISVGLEIRKQGKLLALKNVVIQIVKPQILIYPQPTLIPITENYQISDNQQIKFKAVPYFFNIKNHNDLDYTWSFDNQEATEISDQNPNVFNLQIDDLVSPLSKNLKIWVKNKIKTLQDAQAEALINISS